MSVEVSVLSNGLTVATAHMPHVQTVSLGIWVGVGARWEGDGEHGLSHLLEHMAFKGTPSRSAIDIAEEIEAVGGEINAATSLETTSYFVRILKDDVELALDLLSDILQNPLFDEAELAREKDVIFQEIAAAQDCPDDVVYDLAQELAYPGQALGRPILGTEKSVSAVEPGALRSYLEAHYTADRIVLSASGAVDHAQIVAQAERNLGTLPAAQERDFPLAQYHGGTLRSGKSFEQSHLVLAFEGLTFMDEAYYASQVLSGLFGGGMSSRLFQEVRERRGLCYSIYSFSWGLKDTGLFGVHAATGAEQMSELVSVVTDELQRIATKKPEDAEVARAKAQLKAGLLMSLESSGARAEQLARQMLAYGRPLHTEELIAKVDAVSAESITALAEKILTASRPTCATVSPLGRRGAFENVAAGIE